MLSEHGGIKDGDASPDSRAGKRLKKIEDINDAAAMVFVRDGYAQFSARKVAKELGISLNNLQHYCGNKIGIAHV